MSSFDSEQGLLLFLQRRAPLLMLLIVVTGLGTIVWQLTAAILVVEEQAPSVGVARVESDTFLGLRVEDKTRDEFLRNGWLRQAMSESHRAASSMRRLQMESLSLHDGQHPDTGQSAVVILVKPRPSEVPLPPFLPIAVRRWQPEQGMQYDLEELAEMQLVYRPDESDLTELRAMLSGGRYAQADSLLQGLRWVLVVVVFGGALIILAGAYHGYAWLSAQWDPLVDAGRTRTAMRSLRTARAEREKRD